MWVYWTYMGGAGRQYVVRGEGHHATHSCSFLIVLSRRIWFMFAETVLNSAQHWVYSQGTEKDIHIKTYVT